MNCWKWIHIFADPDEVAGYGNLELLKYLYHEKMNKKYQGKMDIMPRRIMVILM